MRRWMTPQIRQTKGSEERCDAHHWLRSDDRRTMRPRRWVHYGYNRVQEIVSGTRHTYANELPNGVTCFNDDFAACITYLRLPVTHRWVTRTTNLLERLFLEERRRSKTIPHAFGERAVLKLMYAALQRTSYTWQRVAITDFERKQLRTLREELDCQFHEKYRVTKPASRSPISSKRGT